MDRRLADMAAALCALAFATSASGVQRTFVASYGVDTNPCSVTQPCRTFAVAVALTSTNGEVIVLDSAGYGPVTITQSVSIVAPPGVYAGISVFLADYGIWIIAGTGDKVVLRGITINGQGGNGGIIVLTAGEVHIEDCTVANLRTNGIAVSNGPLGATRLFIRDTVVRDNGDAGFAVVQGTPTIHLADSRFTRNTWGLSIPRGTLFANRVAIEDNDGSGLYISAGDDSAAVAVTDSVISGNGSTGVSAFAGSTRTVRIAVVGSTIARNGSDGATIATYSGGGTLFATFSQLAIVDNRGDGVVADGDAVTAVITGSTIAGNSGADIAQRNSAVVRTSQNNTLTGRGAADVVGTLTPNPLR